MSELIRQHGPMQVLAAFHEEALRYQMTIRSANRRRGLHGSEKHPPRPK
jgi:hypothetical protein